MRVQFLADRAEVAVTYAHGADDAPPNPGTKARLELARRAGVRALGSVLVDLGDGGTQEVEVHAIGFSTDTQVTTDTLSVERGA